MEVQFCLTEFLPSTKLCKRADGISLHQGKQPDLLSDLECVIRMTLPSIKPTEMSLGYSVTLGRRVKRALVAFVLYVPKGITFPDF